MDTTKLIIVIVVVVLVLAVGKHSCKISDGCSICFNSVFQYVSML